MKSFSPKIKNIFKILFAILVTALITFFFIRFFKNSAHKNEKIVNVYNWGEFINPKSNEKFTEETGIKVNYTTFHNNEELFAKLLGGSANYDVIIPSDYMISKLIENDMLAKLDYNNIPNYKFIDKRFKNLSFDPQSEYSVAYTYGNIGLIYNKNFVQKHEIEERGWDILWSEKFKKKILMFDNSRDTFAIALLKLGFSVNSNNPDDWQKAFDELLAQKSVLQTYVMDQIFDKINNNEAVLAPYYAGDAFVMMKNNPNVNFAFPKQGVNMFVDAMCVPKNSQNKQFAEEYINFMCRTDIALSNVLTVGYSTPHTKAFELLDENIKNNKILYPNENVINNSQIYTNLLPETNKLLDELWTKLKVNTKSADKWLLIKILSAFLILYILAKFHRNIEHRY